MEVAPPVEPAEDEDDVDEETVVDDTGLKYFSMVYDGGFRIETVKRRGGMNGVVRDRR